MALLVKKFGGTSIGTPEKVIAIADHVRESYLQGHELIVVVSAMGHTTDELIGLAHRVAHRPPQRELDMLLTAGERISMSLLSMALADRQIPAISLTGSQSGIVTDGSHGRARIKTILGNRVRAGLSEHQVVIVAGFQGVSESKEVTTLGRGGSDTTAVALAAIFKAMHCEIYTDVDGVYSADPAWVPQARCWKYLPHDFMVELSTRGAGVLHPRSVELAKQYHVPLQVKNSFSRAEGTIIGDEKKKDRGEGLVEEFDIVGVTCHEHQCFIQIELARPSLLNLIWEVSEQNHWSIVAPVFSGTEVKFFSDCSTQQDWQVVLEKLLKDGFLKRYEILSQVIPLSVVGHRFAQDGKALYQIGCLLEQEKIPVYVGSSSSLALTVGVPRHCAQQGVKALHAALIEKKRLE